MNFIDTVMEKWNAFYEKVRPTVRKVRAALSKAGNAIVRGWKYTLKMRKAFLGIPVGIIAVLLALYNMTHLPSMVGLNLLPTGEFSFQIIRGIAVLGPMAITAFCLLLMFISRRLLTPWLVSVFSLVLPVVILITNTFPA